MTTKSALLIGLGFGVIAIGVGWWEWEGLRIPQAPAGLGESERTAIDVMVRANEAVTTIATLVFGGFGFLVTRPRRSGLGPLRLLGALVILEVLASSLAAGLILDRHLAFILINNLGALSNAHIWAVFRLQICFLIAGALMFVVYAAALLAEEPAEV